MEKIKEKMKLLKSWFVSLIKNLKWFFGEVINVYSHDKSFFSKKRIESGLAFLLAQFGMMFFLFKKIDSMDIYEFSIWASIEFIIAGYTVNQIQKEKKTKNVDSEND